MFNFLKSLFFQFGINFSFAINFSKVQEKRAALRRKRTRNKKYASDEYTSIYSERKALTQSYTDVVGSEEIVTFDNTVEVVEMTVDQVYSIFSKTIRFIAKHFK